MNDHERKSKLREEIQELEERIGRLQYELMQKRGELYSQTPTTFTTQKEYPYSLTFKGRFA